MEIARVGTRVVMGPDWSKGGEDGGEGHVGTVKVVNNNKTVDVLWDKGQYGIYSIGKDNKYELLLFDKAAFGQTHTGIRCGGCQATDCMGIIWACQECPGIYLCNSCYCSDKHDIRHRFKRIDNPGMEGVAVSKRSISYKVRSYGMFVGAKVKRLQNCTRKGDEHEHVGTVTAIVHYDRQVASENAVKVKWSNNETSICRPGEDVICVEDMPGLSYYRDHLLLLRDGSEDVSEGKAESETEKPTRPVTTENLSTTVDENTPLGHRLQTNEYIIERQPEGSSLKVGDNVRIIDDIDQVRSILNEQWSNSMTDVIGKVGTITHIYTDGNLEVDFSNKAWVFSPACCESISKQKPPSTDTPVNTSDSQASGDITGNTTHIQHGHGDVAQLLEHISAVFPSVSDVPPRLLFEAASSNNAALTFVTSIRCPHLVNAKHDEDVTALMIASHEGHTEVVQVLLKARADLNLINTDGATALTLALANGHEQIALLLIREGADANLKDKHRRTAMHFAAYLSATDVIKELIDRKVDPNVQDEAGDTPLHISIQFRNCASASDLVKYHKTNLLIKNKHGQSPLLVAAINNDVKTIESILMRCPVHKNRTITDGALQAATFHNHTDVVRVLIKMDASVNDSSEHHLLPLHYACFFGQFEISKLLVEAGASVNKKDKEGLTPLHFCVTQLPPGSYTTETNEMKHLFTSHEKIQERTDIACFLIEHGASVLVKDIYGQCPLHSCAHPKMKDVIVRAVTLHRARGTYGINLYDRLFSRMPMPCVKCLNIMSDFRIVPCGHVVLCRACAFGVKECPRCKTDIEERCEIYRSEGNSNTT